MVSSCAVPSNCVWLQIIFFLKRDSHTFLLTSRNTVSELTQAHRDFKIHRRVRNENVKKKGLISKTTTLHVHHIFLYISLPFLHDYDVKMPTFAFCGERN